MDHPRLSDMDYFIHNAILPFYSLKMQGMIYFLPMSLIFFLKMMLPTTRPDRLYKPLLKLCSDRLNDKASGSLTNTMVDLVHGCQWVE